MKQCFKCGGDTTRESRVDNNLKIDPSQDLRPVCDNCIASLKDRTMIEFEKIEVLQLVQLIHKSNSTCKGALILTSITKDIFLDLFVSGVTKIPLTRLRNETLTEGEKIVVRQCLESLYLTVYIRYGQRKLEEILDGTDMSGLSFLAIDYLESLKGQSGIHYIDDIDYILEAMGDNPTGAELDAEQISTPTSTPQMWGGEWAHDQDGGVLPEDE